MNKKRGVILVSGIVGLTPEDRIFETITGLPTYLIDITDNQKGVWNSFPFPLNVLAPADRMERLAKLAQRIDQEEVFIQIIKARAILAGLGCDHIVGVGSSLGATFLLNYQASASRMSHGLDGIVAWSPLLSNPANVSLALPNFSEINCPLSMFFGEQDQVVPESIPLAEAAVKLGFFRRLRIFPGVGHSFWCRRPRSWMLKQNPDYDCQAAIGLRWESFNCVHGG